MITETSGEIIFVESNRPPRPTSIIAISTSSFSNYENLHKNKDVSPLSNQNARFSHTDKEINYKGYRRYKI